MTPDVIRRERRDIAGDIAFAKAVMPPGQMPMWQV